MAKPKILTEIFKIEENTKEALDRTKNLTGDAQEQITSLSTSKQDNLVSGTNIKTINNNSILGSGDLEIVTSGAVWGQITGTLSNQEDLQTELTGLDSKITALDPRLIPAGGAAKEVLKKASATDYDLEWGIAAGNQVHIGPDAPTGTDEVIWIDTDETGQGIESTVTRNSTNLITSGGVYDFLMTGASADAPGTRGVVPAPAAGDNEKFLKGDGTWSTLSGNFIENPASKSDGQILGYNGTSKQWEAIDKPTSGVWGQITGTLSDQTDLKNALDAKQDSLPAVTNDRYLHTNASTGNLEWSEVSTADMVGATSSAAGTHGLVPAPAIGDNTKFLCGDGSWKNPSYCYGDTITIAAETLSYTITHNLNTRYLIVQVIDSNFSTVQVDVTRNTDNTVLIEFGTQPTVGTSYGVLCQAITTNFEFPVISGTTMSSTAFKTVTQTTEKILEIK